MQQVFEEALKSIEKSILEQNTGWSKPRALQEANKILVAIYQNILSKEFLPIILGSEDSKKIKDLSYDENNSPQLTVEELVFSELWKIPIGYSGR